MKCLTNKFYFAINDEVVLDLDKIWGFHHNYRKDVIKLGLNDVQICLFELSIILGTIEAYYT